MHATWSAIRRGLAFRGEGRHAAKLPLGNALTLTLYLVGAAWRGFYVLSWHDPRRFIYSDMKLYLDLAKRFASPDPTYLPVQTIHPPGTSKLFSLFYSVDPGLESLVWFQFCVSLLVPIAVGMLAWAAFDRTVARWAVTVASLYLPFVDYAGYFLSEIYMAFCVPVCLAAYLWATGSERIRTAVVGGVLAGLSMLAAFSLKVVALPTLGTFAV